MHQFPQPVLTFALGLSAALLQPLAAEGRQPVLLQPWEAAGQLPIS